MEKRRSFGDSFIKDRIEKKDKSLAQNDGCLLGETAAQIIETKRLVSEFSLSKRIS